MMLLEGRAGFDKALRVFRDLTSGELQHFSVKYDGAPAVFFGKTRYGEFVATKSIFNKKPVAFYSFLDSRLDDMPEGLARKVRALLLSCLSLPMNSAVQCDLLFSEESDKAHTVLLDGYGKQNERKYVTLHPNVIRYHFREGTPDASRIEFSCVGLVPHTYYSVDDELRLAPCAAFDVEWSRYVFTMDTHLRGTALNVTPVMFRRTPPSSFETAHTPQTMNGYVRAGRSFPADNPVEDAYKWLSEMKDYLLSQVMEREESWATRRTFLTVAGHEIDTSHEGLVYDNGEFSCKLVNRREFSIANFSQDYVRGWKPNK
jgi:hypothetical protein